MYLPSIGIRIIIDEFLIFYLSILNDIWPSGNYLKKEPCKIVFQLRYNAPNYVCIPICTSFLYTSLPKPVLLRLLTWRRTLCESYALLLAGRYSPITLTPEDYYNPSHTVLPVLL